MLIRVVLQRQLPVRALDVRVAGAAAEIQELVLVRVAREGDGGETAREERQET